MVGRNEDGTGPASRVRGRCGVRSGDGSQGGGCAEKHYGGPGSPPRGALRLSLKVEWGVGSPGQGSSLIAQLVKNLPAMWDSQLTKIPWSRDGLPTPVFWLGKSHGLYRSWGRKESNATFTFTFSPGGGGGMAN